MAVSKLRNGDYCPDGVGGFLWAVGEEEVLERVMFKLTARRGKFPLMPELGSRIYLLLRERPSARGAIGASYAAEALADEPDLTVTGADWNEEARLLTVDLTWRGESFRAAVEV